MTVERIDYLYLETRNFGKSARFWQSLGFELVLDLGTSGRLQPKAGGPGVFLEEVSPETPLAVGVYLGVDDLDLPPEVEKVGDAIETHWGTSLQTVRDPDGREFVLQKSQ